MTDDAMKKAREAWAERQDRLHALPDIWEAGWNGAKAHHYAEVHELREALKDVLDDCSMSMSPPLAEDIRNLLAKGGDDAG